MKVSNVQLSSDLIKKFIKSPASPVVILFICLILSLPAYAASDKGKDCIDCHPKIKDKISVEKAHEPVEKNNCIACHDPHASNHKGLLNKSLNKLCYKCHQKDKPGIFDRKVLHEPIRTGDCSSCHDPHSSKNDKLLVSKGGELCYKCHTKKNLTGGKESHRLAKQGKCGACHDPHSSQNKGMLLKNIGDLCSACHDPSKGTFVRAHSNYSVGESDCGQCHNVHSSENTKLLKASIHKPMEEKKCADCHNSADSKNPLALKSSGVDLCYKCHEKTRMSFKKVNNHITGDRANFCMNCHNAHASDSRSLLENRENDVCFTCHQDTQTRMAGDDAKFKHPKSDDCSMCHTAHGSDNELFLIAEEGKLCGTGKCHQAELAFSHPVGDDILDPRNNKAMNCITCHDPMGTDFKYHLRLNPDGTLCLECHNL